MSSFRSLAAGVVLAGAVAAALSQPAEAVIRIPVPAADASAQGGVQLVDARSYHHCHNMPRRTRCHRKARLPVNWPPNTNTPGSASQRDQAAKAIACSGDRRTCGR